MLAVAEILTVGLPFCVFKLLTGLIAWRTIGAIGLPLMALGAIDLAINLVNLGGLMVRRRRIIGTCLGHIVLRNDLGLALDIFLSFALVALVVGFALYRHLSPAAVLLWNVAVVLNVLGAGIGRLLAAIKQREVDA
jgi:hypothetical protein